MTILKASLNSFIDTFQDKYGLLLLLCLMSAALLFFDVAMPLGVAAGITYIPVMLLTIWLPRKKQVILMAIVISSLILIGYLLTPNKISDFWIVIVNRTLSLMAVVSIFIVIYLKITAADFLGLKGLSNNIKDEEDYLNESDTVLGKSSNDRINRIGFYSIIITLPTVIIIVGMNLWLSYKSDYVENLIIQTHAVETSLSRVFSTLQDAELGQRGYLLTGDISYLKPYINSMAEITGALDIIHKQTSNKPRQKLRLARIVPLLDDKLETLGNTILLMKAQDKAAALNIVTSGEGKDSMDQIRVIINEMEVEESELLIQKRQLLKSNNILVIYAQIIGLALLILIGIFSFYKVRKLLFMQLKAEEKHRYISDHDSVTGLLNERAMRSQFNQLAKQYNAVKRPAIRLRFTLIYYRNHYQLQSDHGNDLANKVLKNTAEMLSQNLPKNTIFGRLNDGGFLALAEVGSSALPSFWHEVNSSCTVGDFEFSLDPTAIIVEYPKDGYSFDSLLMHASIALHRAYKDRKQVLKFNYSFLEKSLKRSEYASQIKTALSEGQFELYLQPKVNIRDQKIIGAEALIRWNHPEDGLLGPDQFLDIVEHSNARYDFTLFVIQQSVQYFQEFSRQGQDIQLSFNLNAYDIHDARILAALRSNIQEIDVSMGSLQMELTETATAHNVDSIKHSLDEISKMGYSIAIDDFGTGMSSLAYCHRLPIDTIKIDRSFILEIQKSERSQLLVKTIIDMAKCFSWNVIAEGIENNEVASMLLDLGCEDAQGYFFSKPITFEKFCELLPVRYQLGSSVG